MTTIILKFRSCDHRNAVKRFELTTWLNCIFMSTLRKMNVVLCENIVVLYWMSVICVMVVLEPFNRQWNAPPPCFKNPISERVFFSMRDDSLHTVHSGAIDSKGHRGVLLGKRWFLSLPCEQSHPSGCHFRASWNNLQFIAAVVALNWSWAHFANASATSLVNSTERSLLWEKKKKKSFLSN